METLSHSLDAILKIIYELVKNDAFPLKLKLHPRDLILRSMLDWSEIEAALKQLETGGLVILTKSEKLDISITAQGLEKCKSSNH